MAARKTRKPIPEPTDKQRFDAIFAALVAAGVAYVFDMRGATGVREDRYNDYTRTAERAGTELWVGEHVGHIDFGGAYWGTDGVLRAGPPPVDRGWGYPPAEDNAVRELWWSYNHEHPALAELLVALFTWQGIDAWWSGDDGDCVIVHLDKPRTPVLPEPVLALPAGTR